MPRLCGKLGDLLSQLQVITTRVYLIDGTKDDRERGQRERERREKGGYLIRIIQGEIVFCSQNVGLISWEGEGGGMGIPSKVKREN